MFKVVLLLCLHFTATICSNSQLNFVRQKPSNRKKWLNTSKIVPIANEDSSITAKPSMSFMSPLKQTNHFNSLSEDLIQEIFEYIIEDHQSVRLICKGFCKIYDDFILRMTWSNFPESSETTFSSWVKYQLIPLAQILHFNLKPVMAQYKRVFYNTMPTNDLRHNSVQLIKYMRVKNIRECLKLTNYLLKLEIIEWFDIYNLLFVNHFGSVDAVLHAWSLGLTTIARKMEMYNLTTLIWSIDPQNNGILIALKTKSYTLSKFMICSLRDHTRVLMQDQFYLNEIIEEIINAQFWDLLNQVHEMNRSFDYSVHMVNIARRGLTGGLKALRSYAMNNCRGLAYLAATFGHLEFLKELDAMGLLRVSSTNLRNGDSAIHCAALHGRTGCLEFLVDRLGSDLLSLEDQVGFMPIHLAAHSGNPDTLKAIIRRYPHYKSKFLRFSSFKVSSPLNIAITCGLPEASRILIEHFPELLKYKDESRNTVIHLAISAVDDEILELLLDHVSPETISARNIKGNTALHFAAEIPSPTKVQILMQTGRFTALERNNFGRTPVSLYKQWHFNILKSELMRIFNLKTEDQVDEALNVNKKHFMCINRKYF